MIQRNNIRNNLLVKSNQISITNRLYKIKSKKKKKNEVRKKMYLFGFE